MCVAWRERGPVDSSAVRECVSVYGRECVRVRVRVRACVRVFACVCACICVRKWARDLFADECYFDFGQFGPQIFWQRIQQFCHLRPALDILRQLAKVGGESCPSHAGTALPGGKCAGGSAPALVILLSACDIWPVASGCKEVPHAITHPPTSPHLHTPCTCCAPAAGVRTAPTP